jgi:hypothetical protein
MENGLFYVVKFNWKITNIYTCQNIIIQFLSKMLRKFNSFAINYSRIPQFIDDNMHKIHLSNVSTNSEKHCNKFIIFYE